MVLGGHLGNLYGHKNIVIVGALWWMTTGIASSLFAQIRYLPITLTSAAIGSALAVPNLMGILVGNIPHGGHRNLTVMVCGAMGPLGAGRGHFVLQGLLKINWIPPFM